jgi:hypothetical protein
MTTRHVSPRKLWEYQEGLLSDQESNQIAEHVRNCENCKKAIDLDQSIFTKFQESRPNAAGAGSLRFVPSDRPVERTINPLRWAVTVAGVAILAFGGIGVFNSLSSRKAYQPTPVVENNRSTEPQPIVRERGNKAQPPPVAHGEGMAAPGHKNSERKTDSTVSKQIVSPKNVVEGSVEGGRAASNPATPTADKDTGKNRSDGKSAVSLNEAAKPSGGLGGFGGGGGGAGGYAALGYLASVTVHKDHKQLSQSIMERKVGEKEQPHGDSAELLRSAASKDSLREEVRSQQLTDVAGNAKNVSDYLYYRVNLDNVEIKLGKVVDELRNQTSVGFVLPLVLSDTVVSAQFKNAELGIALGNIAIATGTEWEDMKGQIRFFSADEVNKKRDVKLGATARSVQDGAKKAILICPTCKLRIPQRTWTWIFCPFCGNPLGKP